MNEKTLQIILVVKCRHFSLSLHKVRFLKKINVIDKWSQSSIPLKQVFESCTLTSSGVQSYDFHRKMIDQQPFLTSKNWPSCL